MKTGNVSTLTKMSLDTPELEDFNFEKAFITWCSIKDRYIMSYIPPNGF